MKVQLPLAQATALLNQSSQQAGDITVLELIIDRLRADAVREYRQRVEDLLRTLGPALDPPPELATAVAQARQFLEIEPANPTRPSAAYERALRTLTARVKALRVAAATYVVIPDGAEAPQIHKRLGQTAEAHGGSVCWSHHDRDLSDWPLWDRPGWQHVQRLVQGRQITLLAVESAADLVPPMCVGEPQWGRDGLETWLHGWGIRLLCRTEAEAGPRQ
ncbi:hypothetical protein ACFWXK_10400 [Streptomyces sp. NPDC059070]|uniref:hypothetical protein n=1 Tax=Streptomyces sp. NPDC059070 TaxID=3346713 RepID=UPI00369383A0